MFSENALGVVQWLALALFLGLWAVIGYKDFTHQKIKHNLIGYGAGGAAAGYAALLAMTLLGLRGIVLHYPLFSFYTMIATHLVLCVCAALLMWWLGIWPAGDAKLFILLAALYPLMNAAGPQQYQRLFLSTLINTFLPAALFLFLTATHYIYDTRLRHSAAFLKQLGWRKEISFLFSQTLAAAREGLSGLPAKLKALWDWAAADPKAIFGLVSSWFISMVTMSLFSCYLTSFFSSPLRMTLLWTGLFLLWQRAVDMFGPATRWVAGAAVVALFIVRPPADWHHFAVVFQNITVFSFFMFLGMNWAIKIISGGGGMPFILPLLLPFLGMFVSELWGYAYNGLHSLMRVAGGMVPSGPIGRTQPVWQPGPLTRRLGSNAVAAMARVNDLVGGFNNPMLKTIFVLSTMGLFFGLSLVMVRLWDQEVRPIRTPKTLTPFLLLAPAFVDRIRQDPEFFEAHFSKLYPDGLTRDQVEALQEWCEEHAVETIPLAPTMSFAAWIFLGYFLSFLLGGGHVLEAVL